MSTPARKPAASGTPARSGTANTPSGSPSISSSRSPSRASTPTSTAAAATNGVARTRSTRDSARTPLSARGAVKRPGAPSSLSNSASPDDATKDDDARAETQALIQELKDRLQKAEQASEEYQKQVEVLQLRFDDALKDQAKLEERVHEEEERIEGLENEKRETVRQHRELENIYEAERASFMKEKEEAQAREDELHEVIQRLKDGLSQRDLKPGSDEEASFRSNSRNSSQQNLENGHFAPTTSIQRSNSRGSSKLLLQKDKIIESLRLELAEAQIKLVEMENLGGGRLQELERVLLETRMTNARLLEENESFQLLLREKTLNGDFSTGDFLRESTSHDNRPVSRDNRAGPGTSLADELALDGAESVDGDTSESTRRLELEVKELKEQNKALTLYINKIIERVLQHQGFESVLDKNDLEPTKANMDKDLPPPPPPKENAGGFLQRAKTVAMGNNNNSNRPKPRPMSFMAPTNNSVLEDPNTAPSIPLGRSNSNRMSLNLHRRSTSEWPAAAVVSNMYRGPAPASGQISPGIASPRSSIFGLPVSTSGASNRVPSGASTTAASDASKSPPMDGTNPDNVNIDTPSPPRSVTSSFDRPGGAVMGGNKMRPLRLVQEAAEADAEAAAKSKANRTSWIAGWFNKGGNAANPNEAPPQT